jgi:hypothetical protein
MANDPKTSTFMKFIRSRYSIQLLLVNTYTSLENKRNPLYVLHKYYSIHDKKKYLDEFDYELEQFHLHDDVHFSTQIAFTKYYVENLFDPKLDHVCTFPKMTLVCNLIRYNFDIQFLVGFHSKGEEHYGWLERNINVKLAKSYVILKCFIPEENHITVLFSNEKLYTAKQMYNFIRDHKEKMKYCLSARLFELHYVAYVSESLEDLLYVEGKHGDDVKDIIDKYKQTGDDHEIPTIFNEYINFTIEFSLMFPRTYKKAF